MFKNNISQQISFVKQKAKIFSIGENQTSLEFNKNYERCKLTFYYDKKQVSIENSDGSSKVLSLDEKLIFNNSSSKN